MKVLATTNQRRTVLTFALSASFMDKTVDEKPPSEIKSISYFRRLE